MHYIEMTISLIAIITAMWGMLKIMLRDVHKDLNDLKEGQKRLEQRLDKSEHRVDHLYQICVEMLGMRHKH